MTEESLITFMSGFLKERFNYHMSHSMETEDYEEVLTKAKKTLESLVSATRAGRPTHNMNLVTFEEIPKSGIIRPLRLYYLQTLATLYLPLEDLPLYMKEEGLESTTAGTLIKVRLENGT